MERHHHTTRVRSARVTRLRTAAAFVTLGTLASTAVAQSGTSVSGGVYLLHYEPLDLSGAEPSTEVYAAVATVERRADPWIFFLQVRARDTKFRPFFPGNVWMEEAWVGYQVTGAFAPVALRLRAGKLYQTLGRAWDGSFLGSVPYVDGLKRNPQFGLEAAGTIDVGPGTIGYTAQYLLASDRVSGAHAGRDFETLDGFRNQDGFSARATFSVLFGVTAGVSYLSRGVDDGLASHRVPHVALDLEMGLPGGPVLAYVEWARRADGDLPGVLVATQAGSAATYWLAGLQLNHGRLHLRYNYSRGWYEDIDRREWIHQPGVTFELDRHVTAIAEFNWWRARDAGLNSTTDRSLSLVLLLTF